MDSEAGGAMGEGTGDLARFRRMVAEDEALHLALLAARDVEDFAALTVEQGERHGFHFTVAEVREALAAERRGWRQHWI